MMRTSHSGVNLIKQFEGLELEAYQDIAGVWTIGYGHTHGFHKGLLTEYSVIDEREAEILLRKDLFSIEREVNRVVTTDINQNEFDALVSFEFNTGGLGRSTALARLNAGDREGAAQALTWWCKARVDGELRVVRGLKLRREGEAALFLQAPANRSPHEKVSPC